MMSIENILATLSCAEKLAALDFPWRELSANPANVASPSWHRDVLKQRIANSSDKPGLPIDAAFDDGRINEVAEGCMRMFTAVVERCVDTSLFVGYVPAFPGAHSQGETLDELQQNLAEIVGMLREDGEPELESEFIGT